MRDFAEGMHQQMRLCVLRDFFSKVHHPEMQHATTPGVFVTVRAPPLMVTVVPMEKLTPALESDHRRDEGNSSYGTNPGLGQAWKSGEVRPLRKYLV